MTNLISHLNKIVFKRSETDTPPPGTFEVVKFRKSLLKALGESRRRGTTIGIYSDVLGEGMFMTAVEDIYEDTNEIIIVLKRYDLSGSILQRNTLSLSEIRAVCAFDTQYKNPVLI